MIAVKPEDLPRLFVQALTAGNIEMVVSLYESEAIVAPDPSRIVRGHAAIREMVSQFLASKPRFVLHETEAVHAGSLALVRSKWTIALHNAEGKFVEMQMAPSLVARQQPAGHWLVVIDRPLSGA